jgi:hypothetical protein
VFDKKMNTDKYILEQILEKPENKDIHIIGKKKLFRPIL